MRTDICRRFAFGEDIDENMVLLPLIRFGLRWEPPMSSFPSHHLQQDRDTDIQTFARFGFATRTDLGYDPTIKRVLVNGRPQYDIQVSDKTYRTTGVLSDFGADGLLGRGTRVFKVYDVK
jgi:hypothetical protein